MAAMCLATIPSLDKLKAMAVLGLKQCTVEEKSMTLEYQMPATPPPSLKDQPKVKDQVDAKKVKTEVKQKTPAKKSEAKKEIPPDPEDLPSDHTPKIEPGKWRVTNKSKNIALSLPADVLFSG